ncbi:MAG TPA: hypothetical protein VMU94_19255 [Streptosporangiaceae bacterium]|nr:hypothetical protein [Streptosporangiaceae bacterium]
MPTFAELLAEGSAVAVEGWDSPGSTEAAGPFAATSVRFLIEARKEM